MIEWKKWLIPAAALLALTACRAEPTQGTALVEPEAVQPVTVEIKNTNGEAIGSATLRQMKAGVQIEVEVSGLTPGLHGFHIHQNGTCEPPEFKSAGDHFNPDGKQHGFENPRGFHNGDLPNLEVNQDGKASAVMVAKKVTLETGAPNSLLKPGGTSLIIHEKVDDYKTDPSGNSGARIACGIIK
ncbi:superoxide dismutase family protein [Paenibacillus sp. y28]|uniref:superoxide dismutase family protein n=1 Tax=Paenibacillus sp. y28 TaxID=3129110 RepID=UPI00301835DB